MSEKEIFEKISEIIEDRFEIKADEITENLNFQEDLDADSIDIVEFVLELEDVFGAEIPDIHTVGDAVKYIYSHQG